MKHFLALAALICLVQAGIDPVLAQRLLDVTTESSERNGSSSDSLPGFETVTQSDLALLQAPVITTTPPTKATINEIFLYNVDATGDPEPTFALIVAPTGMRIDDESGLIVWLPNELGEFDVTIRAVNGVPPDAEQSFTLPVVEPTTYLESDTIFLKELESRSIKVFIENESNGLIKLNSVRVNDKIPAYTPELYPTIDDDGRIVTDCFIYRFLSSYRPIKEPPIKSTYTVSFERTDGMLCERIGDVVIDYYEGDINLDGVVNTDDLNILTDYLFRKGATSAFEELMDLDHDGDCDLEDLTLLQDWIH